MLSFLMMFDGEVWGIQGWNNIQTFGYAQYVFYVTDIIIFIYTYLFDPFKNNLFAS